MALAGTGLRDLSSATLLLCGPISLLGVRDPAPSCRGCGGLTWAKCWGGENSGRATCNVHKDLKVLVSFTGAPPAHLQLTYYTLTSVQAVAGPGIKTRSPEASRLVILNLGPKACCGAVRSF